MNISLEELKKATQALLIDVRTKEEVQEGIIPGALHIPLSKLSQVLEMSSAEQKASYGVSLKEKEIIFYCKSGGRSALACTYARELGLKTYNFRGGIIEWKKAGLPLATLI